MIKIATKTEKGFKKDIVSSFLEKNEISVESLAWEYGFYKQSPKKVKATCLISGFYGMMQGKINSLRNWAVETGLLGGTTLCKSSLDERLGPNFVSLLEAVLTRVMSHQIKKFGQMGQQANSGVSSGLLSHFNHILLSDSTCQSLPSYLASYFPSSYTANNSAATLRVQAVYNYTACQFAQFKVGNYRNNDQSAASDILEVVKEKDLVLRDLGYFVIPSLRRIIQCGAFFISRYRAACKVYDPKSGQAINLLELFNGKNEIDTEVLLGKEEKLPVRLIAKKVPAEVARQRVAKAKKDRNKKTNHSAEYYKLLEWNIFLTNVGKEVLNPQQIIDLYGLRWHIETIFKAWKSHFNFKKLLDRERMHYWRTLSTIYLILIHITVVMDVYEYVSHKVELETSRQISILKFFDVFNLLYSRIMHCHSFEQLDQFVPQFAAHAVYEKRKNRRNLKERYMC